jgi:hypothetical protein
MDNCSPPLPTGDITILLVNSLADEENGLVPSHRIQNGIGDEIDANGFRNGVTPSDHAPVKATLHIT